MAKAEVSITVRLEKAQEKRLLDVVAATDSEVTRSGVVRLALEHLFASLSVSPSMLPGYDPDKDKSVRQKKRRADKGAERETKKEKEA